MYEKGECVALPPNGIPLPNIGATPNRDECHPWSRGVLPLDRDKIYPKPKPNPASALTLILILSLTPTLILILTHGS